MSDAALERGDPSDKALLDADRATRQRDAEVAERVSVERAATRWSDLMSGSVASEVTIVSLDGVRTQGIVIEAGADWCVLEVSGCAVLLPLSQVLTVSGLTRAAPRVGTRASMGWVLRRWAQMRSDVIVHLVDRSVLRGQVAEVLADAFTVRVDPPSESGITVPLTAVSRVTGDLFSAS